VNLTRWLARSDFTRYAQNPTTISGGCTTAGIPLTVWLTDSALASWPQEVLYLSFDTTMLWIRSASNASRWCIGSSHSGDLAGTGAWQ